MSMLPIPAARRSLKIELTAPQVAELDLIAARHYEANRKAYEEAGEKQMDAARVAAVLLEDAIRRELRPARQTPKSPGGSTRPEASRAA